MNVSQPGQLHVGSCLCEPVMLATKHLSLGWPIRPTIHLDKNAVEINQACLPSGVGTEEITTSSALQLVQQ